MFWCLGRLKIQTVRDLLFHCPVGVRTYPLSALTGARSPERVTVRLRITDYRLSPKRLVLYGEEPGQSGSPFALQVVFFKGNLKQLKALFIPGSVWFFSGELSLFDACLSLVHPLRWCSVERGPPPLREVIYPLTTGLKTTILQSLVGRILEGLPPSGPEWLPEAWVSQETPSFSEALKALHNPESPEDLALHGPARMRLARDELLAYQLTLRRTRQQRSVEKGSALRGDGSLRALIRHRFPFDLTASQEQVLGEIQGDLEADRPMARLLQGDVGSGKTIVAILALAQALESGYQGAFLAPTALLASQQADSLQTLLEGLGFPVALLTRTTLQKAKLCQKIASGEIKVVVGTHALLEEGVTFEHLGLVVIDEQHRFGVAQRQRLTQKGQAPHLLSMSATPIPRTLERALFGDLDVSTLREKPAGRGVIETRVLAASRLRDLEDFLKRQVALGAQIYWVCPLIAEGEEREVSCKPASLTPVTVRFEHLQKVFGDGVALLHGKQKPAEKQETLDRFRKGEIQILVSTTVIEVGVDVPKATCMVIEDAQQFGLAQLHQLRGRVGRGRDKSYCFLLYKPPLSGTARSRLESLRQTTDGFLIAEQDYRLRGGGDVLGMRQSGLPLFHFADLEAHETLLTSSCEMAHVLSQAIPCRSETKGLQLLCEIFRRGNTPAPLM
jgi:ATP-dependent DNA helicase RecG